ncbi:MFS transporter [Streptomyces sp. NPDC048566]|uniref:MFS transporter n=1 Tax=Streptomyces sp. NPDC048566 TaxID=3365569 RepID=UPI00371C3757
MQDSTITPPETAADATRPGRAFTAVQAAILLNGIGTRCGQLAIAWWSLGRTGSATSFAALVAAGSGAEVLARGLLGRLGDTHRPDRLVTACYLVSAVLVAGLTGLHLAGLYQPVVLAAGLVVIGLCNGVREPVQTTLVRSLVPVALVETAMRRRGGVMALSSVLGPIVAAVLLGLAGTGPTLAINTIAVAVSCLLVATVSATSPETTGGGAPPGRGGRTSLATWYRGTVDGWRAVHRIRSEFHLALLALAVNLALYPVFAVLLPALTRRAFPDATWLMGVAEAAFGVGLLLGSTGPVARRTRGTRTRFTTVTAGFTATGLSILAAGLAAARLTGRPGPLAAVLAACFLVGGVGLVTVTVTTSTVRVLATPAGMRNRVTAGVTFLSGLAIPLGNLLGGSLAERLWEGPAMAALGLAVLAATAAGATSRDLRTVLTLPDDAVPDAYGRLYPLAFPGGEPEEVTITGEGRP